MDKATFAELNRAALALVTAHMRLGSGVDETTDENTKRISRANDLVRKVLHDELQRNPAYIDVVRNPFGS